MHFRLFIVLILFTTSLSGQNRSETKFFTEFEKSIILSGDSSDILRVLNIKDSSDLTVLLGLSEDISTNDHLLPLLANRMYKTVLDPENTGVGIAAPQVGINRNLVWVQRFDKRDHPFEFFINPKIVWRSDLFQLGPEGDLSIDTFRQNIYRNYVIGIEYTTLAGETKTEILEGFTAVIFQHETDHLKGILISQKWKDQQMNNFERAERKGKQLYLQVE